jgi:hypothetical protein
MNNRIKNSNPGVVEQNVLDAQAKPLTSIALQIEALGRELDPATLSKALALSMGKAGFDPIAIKHMQAMMSDLIAQHDKLQCSFYYVDTLKLGHQVAALTNASLGRVVLGYPDVDRTEIAQHIACVLQGAGLPWQIIWSVSLALTRISARERDEDGSTAL